MALIDTFLKDPAANGHLWKAMFDSAQARPDVTVNISYAVMPWLCRANGNLSPEQKATYSILLGAFLAGDMRAQLVSRSDKDQPYAGVQAVLIAYRSIRSRNSTFFDPSVDAWVALDSLGTLRSHVDSLATQQGRGCR